MVTEQDFLAAHDELIPSVSAGELAHYERVRATFEGGRDAQKQQQTQVTQGNGAPAAAAAAAAQTRPASSRGSKGKGKGKAVAGRDEMSDEEMNGFVNGSGGKGKGKAKAAVGFQDGTASDDDGLY